MRRAITLATVVVLLALAPAAVAAVGGSGTATAASGGSTQAVTGHQSCEFPVTMTDASGTEVTVDDEPERVTTLAPSAAQTMWEIGGKGQVVGVTQFALYLDGAGSKANVSASGGFGVSVEKVVGTEPDLVLAPNVTSRETVQSLRDAGLTVYLFETATSIEDIAEKTTTIGRLTGNCHGAAETNAWMEANVEAASEVTADVERRSVIYPLGFGFVAGNETFIDAMITVAGGENVAADEIVGYQKLSAEVVIELDPEYLILTPATTYLASQSPYNETTAGEEGNVVTVRTEYINQPAPRSVVYGVRNLTEGFHPEAATEAEWVSRSEVSIETPTPTPTETATDSPAPATSPATTETDGPGFGIATAIGAMLVALLALVRRER